MVELDPSRQASLCEKAYLRDHKLVDLDAGSVGAPRSFKIGSEAYFLRDKMHVSLCCTFVLQVYPQFDINRVKCELFSG